MRCRTLAVAAPSTGVHIYNFSQISETEGVARRYLTRLAQIAPYCQSPYEPGGA